MVLLTMTPLIVAAVQRCQRVATAEQMRELQPPSEPPLSEPAPGKPISHAQLIDISDLLKAHASASPASSEDKENDEQSPAPRYLNDLLRGSRIYLPPPKPKPEASPEYRQLMARLRREEEARAYDRMLNPAPPTEAFAQRFPASPNAYMFPTATDLAKEEEDEITYAEINRQLALIINVLVSIIACSIAIWIAARYWSTPKRLALSMTGSGVVAVAEVVIYMGYLRRMKEAKLEEKKTTEIKEVAETWVIEGSGEKKKSVTTSVQKTTLDDDAGADAVRLRKAKHR